MGIRIGTSARPFRTFIAVIATTVILIAIGTLVTAGILASYETLSSGINTYGVQEGTLRGGSVLYGGLDPVAFVVFVAMLSVVIPLVLLSLILFWTRKSNDNQGGPPNDRSEAK